MDFFGSYIQNEKPPYLVFHQEETSRGQCILLYEVDKIPTVYLFNQNMANRQEVKNKVLKQLYLSLNVKQLHLKKLVDEEVKEGYKHLLKIFLD